jgi:hypothetical protein
MLKRLLEEESGMAMGLAVVMIALIGVMGAGLLVFVRNDLEAVVEVNQGQRAFDVADAGLQAAKQQLLADASKGSYDGASPVPDATVDSVWSSAGPGRTLTFAGSPANVRIQYLAPSTTSSQLSDPRYAPELLPPGVSDYPNGRTYFKVTSEGRSGNARRKVEAIYHTVDLNRPKAYFATSNIDLSGSPTITDVSLFAKGSVTGMRADTLQGEDLAYGYWNRSPWNTTARPTKAAGAGAEGCISYAGAPWTGDDRKGDEDYFGSNGGACAATNPRFVDNDAWALANPPGGNPSGTISYPFDAKTIDPSTINILGGIAKSQPGNSPDGSNYYTKVGGANSSVTIGNTGSEAYPNSSTHGTVYFVEFTGPDKGKVTFSVDSPTSSCNSTTSTGCPKGTIVVVNGDFETSSSAEGYEGVVLVHDPNPNDTVTLSYKSTGNFNLRGFANVDGSMSLAGSVNPLATVAVVNHPGFYSIRQWSWRELYE